MAIFVVTLHQRFQSTCLREARLCGRSSESVFRDFNPRACVRHDFGSPLPDVPVTFQSTCLREARPGPVTPTTPTFQSTCLREARLRLSRDLVKLPISIHVPA